MPGKVDPEAQKRFLLSYENIKKKGGHDPVDFVDAVHPPQNPVMACAWIKRGTEQWIRSNTGRKRLNINGAINLDQLDPVVRYDARIDAESTIRLLEERVRRHPAATTIHVICDNARYYRSRAVRQYLESSPITLVFLPPYAPNLNLIERLWKFFKKTIIHNRYFESFDDFTAACKGFFSQAHRHQDALRALLTEKFAIVGE